MYMFTKRKGRKVQVSYDGGMHWQSTGCDTIEQAELWLDDNHDRKFKDYAKDFFRRTDEKSYNFRKQERNKSVVIATLKNKNGMFDNYIMPRWGEYYLSEIKAKEIDRWFISVKGVRFEETLSPSSRNYLLALLSQILEQAVRDGILEVNEAKKVEPLAVRPKKHGSLSLDELKILFPEDDGQLMQIYKSRLKALYFMIFKDTGFRPSEILALRYEDINEDGSVYTEKMYDFHTKTIEQRIKTSNSGQKYKIGFLSEQTMRFVGDNTGYIFDYDKHDHDDYNSFFKKIVKNLLGRTDLTQYCLRHAFMTNLVSKYPKELIMELMGHRQWESCYDDRTPEMVIDNLRTALRQYRT